VSRSTSGTGTLSTIVSARSRAAVTGSTLNLRALMSSSVIIAPSIWLSVVV